MNFVLIIFILLAVLLFFSTTKEGFDGTTPCGAKGKIYDWTKDKFLYQCADDTQCSGNAKCGDISGYTGTYCAAPGQIPGVGSCTTPVGNPPDEKGRKEVGKDAVDSAPIGFVYNSGSFITVYIPFKESTFIHVIDPSNNVSILSQYYSGNEKIEKNYASGSTASIINKKVNSTAPMLNLLSDFKNSTELNAYVAYSDGDYIVCMQYLTLLVAVDVHKTNRIYSIVRHEKEDLKTNLKPPVDISGISDVKNIRVSIGNLADIEIPASTAMSFVSKYFSSMFTQPGDYSDYILKSQIVPGIGYDHFAYDQYGNETVRTGASPTGTQATGGKGNDRGVGNFLKDSGQGVGNFVQSSAAGVGQYVSGAADGAVDLTKQAVGGTADFAKQAVGGTVDLTKQAVGGTVDLTKQVVGGTADFAKQVVGGTVDLAKQAVGGTVDLAKQAVGGTVDLVKDTGEGVMNLSGTRYLAGGYVSDGYNNAYQGANLRRTMTGLDPYSYHGAVPSRPTSNFVPITADFSSFGR